MKLRRLTALVPVALVATLALSGCGSQAAPKEPAPQDNIATAKPAPAPAPTPEEPTLSGVVAVHGVTGNRAGSLGVYLIDPASGRSTDYAEFDNSNLSVRPMSEILSDDGAIPVTVSAMFTPDFKKVVARQPATSGGVSDIGWLDITGQFTNATTSLYSAGDFASVPDYRDAQFGPDGKFYFTEDSGQGLADSGNATFLETSVDSPSKPAPIPVDTSDNPYWFWISPNGTVTPMSPGQYFYQENVTPGVGAERAESWVDANTWLSVDSESSRVYLSHTLAAPAAIDVMDWGTSGTALTPDATGFTVSSPVASPDKTQVAFLGTSNGVTNLYIVPITGGQPVLLKTGAPIDSTTILAAWK